MCSQLICNTFKNIAHAFAHVLSTLCQGSSVYLWYAYRISIAIGARSTVAVLPAASVRNVAPQYLVCILHVCVSELYLNLHMHCTLCDTGYTDRSIRVGAVCAAIHGSLSNSSHSWQPLQ
jgi:hypothetical protein